jgi:hypothetical protein
MTDSVWLDQVPYEPPLVGCVECGDPLQPLEVMITWVDRKPVTPLCGQCFDRLHVPGYVEGLAREWEEPS